MKNNKLNILYFKKIINNKSQYSYYKLAKYI